jgi:hypothetical protein
MLDNKFFFSLIGIMITVFAMCNVNFSSSSKEHFFGNPQMSTRVHKVIIDQDGREHSLQNNLQGHLGDDKFIKTANLQAMLSPRGVGNNVNAGARINYARADPKYEAFPITNPMDYANMAAENYSNNPQSKENYGCAQDSFSSSGIDSLPSNYTNGNYETEKQKVFSTGMETVDSLPVGNMSTINALGETIQPVVYDRYIFANRHSRLRSQGDPIRGDLPIVPCNNGWFNVSVNPATDLQTGAMNVMGGVSNSVSNNTSQLVFNSSGNTYDTLGGVSLQNDFANPLSAFNLDVNTMANSFDIEGAGGAGGQETIQIGTFI